MPTIPRINQNRQQSVGLPTAQQSASAPREAFGPDLSGAANAIGQIATRVKQKADTARVMEADTNLMDVTNRLLYDPETGALNARGKNAIGVDEQTLKAFEQETQKIRQELSGDAQISAFDKLVRQRQQQINRSLIQHVNSEMRTYESEQYEALVNGSIETATNNYTDPEVIGMELKRQRGAIMARSADEGWSAEKESQALEAVTSATHSSVIQRMVSEKQYDLAKEYFQATGEQIEPDNYDKIKSLVDKGGKLQEAQETSDRIFAAASDEKEALRMAREINDPEVRDDAVSRIRTRYSEVRRIEDQQKAEAMDTATNIIEGGGAVGDIPVALQERLNNKQLNALKARQQEIASPTRKNNWKVWTEISTASREELAQVEDPYVELRPYLDDSHYNKALNLINKAKGIAQTPEDEFDPSSSMSFLQRVKNTALQSGIIPAEKTPSEYSDDEALRYSRFQSEAAARIEERERELGRRMSGNEQQEVMDEMMLEVYQVEGGLFSRDREDYAWALDEDDMGDTFVPITEIPPGDVTFVKNMLRGNGLPPSDETVQRAYAQYKLGNIEAFQSIITGAE